MKPEQLTSRLKNKDLFRQQAYVNGNWLSAHSGRTLEVNNPSTRDIIGAVPDMDDKDTIAAVQAAKAAFPAWSGLNAKQRSEILLKWYALIIQNQEDLAAILTTEQGKSITEAKTETVYGANFVQWFGEQAKRVNGTIIPAFAPQTQIQVTKEPVGVAAAITPWNFPNAMITRKVAPALAAGCTVVIKPSELTPFTAFALCVLAEQAGVPPGVLNIVTGSPEPIGQVLSTHPDVAKITFTGSTRVGKLLMAQAAGTVKRVSLELGGNAPFIIFDDADLNKAVAGCIISKFRNSGQTCVCANRILVQESIYEAFTEKLTAEVKKLKVGDGFEAGVNQGPLINEAAVQKVERHIADAVKKGGKILTGGNRHVLGGTFFEPTVIRDVIPNAQLCCEETFGPVAGLTRFKTDDEALHMANDSRFGLAAYFFSSSAKRISRITAELQTGMVAVNTGLLATEHIPFGGVKESGLGREGGEAGIEEFLNTKYALIVQP